MKRSSFIILVLLLNVGLSYSQQITIDKLLRLRISGSDSIEEFLNTTGCTYKVQDMEDSGLKAFYASFNPSIDGFVIWYGFHIKDEKKIIMFTTTDKVTIKYFESKIRDFKMKKISTKEGIREYTDYWGGKNYIFKMQYFYDEKHMACTLSIQGRFND